MGLKNHKPDCSCKICSKINEKAARELKKPPAVASVPENIKPETKKKRPLFSIFQFNKKKDVKLEQQTATREAVGEQGQPKQADMANPVLPKPHPLGSGLWRIVIGGGLLVSGLLLAWVWLSFASTSSALAFMVIVMIGGGIFFSWQYFAKKDISGKEVIVLESGEQPLAKNKANALCIYPDRVVFENINKPQGQPWRCKNDGKYYFVQIESTAFTNQPLNVDSTKWTLKAFMLPDSKYYDPSTFATRVLELPAHRRIFRRKETLLERLSPLMAAGAVGIFAIVMLVTLG